MRVGLGSTNPAKRRAVEAALPAATVEPIAVDSGVSEQPRGRAETIRGAETRARRALSALAAEEPSAGDRSTGDRSSADRSTGDRPAADAPLGVGIEGGVADLRGVEGCFLLMWAAVTDGERWGRAAGPSYELPAAIAERVRSGAELGPALDDVLDREDVGRAEGAAGVLTGGRVTRADALKTAVTGALGPFVTDHYRPSR